MARHRAQGPSSMKRLGSQGGTRVVTEKTRAVKQEENQGSVVSLKPSEEHVSRKRW